MIRTGARGPEIAALTPNPDIALEQFMGSWARSFVCAPPRAHGAVAKLAIARHRIMIRNGL